MDMMRSWVGGLDCAGCTIRSRAICAGLAGEAFEAFSGLGRRRILARGQVLSWEAEENRTVGTLVSGALKISAATADGREQIVGLAWPSDFVGNPLAGRTGFRVTALSDSSLCLFDRTDFQAMAAQESALERDLLRRVLADLDRARSFMLLLGRMSAAERLSALLLDIVDRFAEGPSQAPMVELPFRRQEMADVLGLTIETVSRQLGRMSDGGIIEMPDRRRIRVKNLAALKAIAPG